MLKAIIKNCKERIRTGELNMTNTPIHFIKATIANKIVNRSTKLVQQAMSGAITNQEYLADQFPADAISFIEKAITQAIDDFEEKSKCN
jgi:hypothetical protein